MIKLISLFYFNNAFGEVFFQLQTFNYSWRDSSQKFCLKKLDNFPKLTSKDRLKLYDLLDILSKLESTKCDEQYSHSLSYYEFNWDHSNFEQITLCTSREVDKSRHNIQEAVWYAIHTINIFVDYERNKEWSSIHVWKFSHIDNLNILEKKTRKISLWTAKQMYTTKLWNIVQFIKFNIHCWVVDSS